ncbi:MAG: hypothetical protein HYV63_19265 [Candidatus Schekmanbacteria bacterium]|nr:hypothetical protein [Candidatus Schekmanbacteria bacterium]
MHTAYDQLAKQMLRTLLASVGAVRSPWCRAHSAGARLPGDAIAFFRGQQGLAAVALGFGPGAEAAFLLH